VNDNTLPMPVDPLDRAILDLLCKLPLRWGQIDTEELTATEQEALKLLTRTGLVEERIRVRAWMAGFPQTVHMQFRVSGQYRLIDLVNKVLQAVPGWLDANGRTCGPFRLESDGVIEARLTDQGEQARHDYDHNSPENPSFVLAFVKGRGPMGLPQPEVKGTVYVEYCRVETGQEGDSQKRVAVLAAAHATANVGDITVHNHIVVDPGAIAELFFQKWAEHQTTSGGTGPAGRNASPAAQDTAKEQPWADDAPEYLPLSEAAKLIDNRLSLSALSKLLSADGEIRYMRKGRRCKVHIADFRRYMQGRQSDPEWAKNLAVYYTAAGKGDSRLYWRCKQCGNEYPETAKADPDSCPKCKGESDLITKAPPKPRR